MLRQFPLALALSLMWACATVAPVPAAQPMNPVKRNVGEAVKVDALGAQYTFPARFDLPDHSDKPGIYSVKAIDRITSCEMDINFETVADGTAVTQYTNDTIQKANQEIQSKGLKTEITPATIKVLGKEGRVLKLLAKAADNPADRYSSWRFEVFLPEQTLAFHGIAECADEALLGKTFDALLAVFDSQTRTP